ncbi:bacillithiol system redox-active protein YtxJ [Bacillus sp. FJAT-45350]|uniref:bacillithiol system redox-active protein YtxJ n=1 Tax=Bacillus sp. FJAT-45350 TaxID=2011014 RepID=UPI000BB7274B|nr:bacillithiol system redox-active protein YtxJ [Bacillus sp. FJAT-45350]
MSLVKLDDYTQFKELVESTNKLFLLKNSTTCPVSTEAFNEFKKFSDENEGETFYYLNVQDARPLSNQIAEDYQVKHESPQVLLFSNGAVSWHDSHWKVTSKLLTEVWSK